MHAYCTTVQVLAFAPSALIGRQPCTQGVCQVAVQGCGTLLRPTSPSAVPNVCRVTLQVAALELVQTGVAAAVLDVFCRLLPTDRLICNPGVQHTGFPRARHALLLSFVRRLLRPVQIEAPAAVMGISCSQAQLLAPQIASCRFPGASLCAAHGDRQVRLGALAVLHQRSSGRRSCNCRLLPL